MKDHCVSERDAAKYFLTALDKDVEITFEQNFLDMIHANLQMAFW